MAILKQTTARIIQEFQDDCEIRGLAIETTRRYCSSLKTYVSFLKKQNVHIFDVTHSDIIDFIKYLRETRNSKPATIAQFFAALNALYDFLVFNKQIPANFIPSIRKRYLKRFKVMDGNGRRRKVISPEDMGEFLYSIQNPRDQAMATLLVKTGIRRGELISIDMKDINWGNQSIQLKSKRKRTNTTVFFDAECSRVLQRWLLIRSSMDIDEKNDALFLGQGGKRLGRNGVYYAIAKWAKVEGYYDTESDDNADHFSPHNLRHCFTTYLLENGMRREYVQELRGDVPAHAVDIYNHIPAESLREAYLASMPQFGL